MQWFSPLKVQVEKLTQELLLTASKFVHTHISEYSETIVIIAQSQELVKVAREKYGAKVVASIYRRMPEAPIHYEIEHLDVTDDAAVKAALKKHRPDLMIHAELPSTLRVWKKITNWVGGLWLMRSGASPKAAVQSELK